MRKENKMKNTKMIFVYGNYGNKLIRVFEANDSCIELANHKNRPLSLSWHYYIGDKEMYSFRILSADESFQIFDYNEKMFTDAQKEIMERR